MIYIYMIYIYTHIYIYRSWEIPLTLVDVTPIEDRFGFYVFFVLWVFCVLFIVFKLCLMFFYSYCQYMSFTVRYSLLISAILRKFMQCFQHLIRAGLSLKDFWLKHGNGTLACSASVRK